MTGSRIVRFGFDAPTPTTVMDAGRRTARGRDRGRLRGVGLGCRGDSADAVLGPGGQPICAANLTNPNDVPGCGPVNLFGTGSPSRAAINYFTAIQGLVSDTYEHDVAGTLTGDLFSLNGKSVSLAAGAEYRGESVNANSDLNSQQQNFLIATRSPSIDYTNLSLQYTARQARLQMTQYFLKINNVFNKYPPIDPQHFFANIQTNPMLYDTVGRMFYAGVRFQW